MKLWEYLIVQKIIFYSYYEMQISRVYEKEYCGNAKNKFVAYELSYYHAQLSVLCMNDINVRVRGTQYMICTIYDS